MQGQDIGAVFRALHHQDRPFIIPNPWDAGSARMLEAKGFKALASTSAGLAFSLGRPEGVIAREEVMAHCRALVGAVSVPVSADLEDGYGDSLKEVGETYRQAADAGLAGASIEDARSGDGGAAYDVGLAADRVRAAVDAVRGIGRDFVLTARCEHFLHGRPDLGETIRRLQAYQEAGADVLFAPGLTSLQDIRSLVSSVDRPVNVIVGVRDAELTVDQLAAADEMLRTGGFGFAKSAPAYGEINAFFAGRR